MAANGPVGLLAGAILLGAVHGIEPGHGWPVAASYALDRGNKWLYGFAASVILGLGHLLSSIAMVAVFFYAKYYFELTQVNEPIVLAGGSEIGGPVSLVAGILLIALGIREYRYGHTHSHSGHSHEHESHGTHVEEPEQTQESDSTDFQYEISEAHSHEHSDDDHSHSDSSHGHENVSGQGHTHDHDTGHEHGHDHGLDSGTDRGLWGIAWFAFVLGFAHEEEFEIIALCAGSTYCLELMLAYALTVIVGIVGLTLLLIAGYQEFEDEVEKYTPYLPVFSAVVLVIMGLGFISGLL